MVEIPGRVVFQSIGPMGSVETVTRSLSGLAKIGTTRTDNKSVNRETRNVTMRVNQSTTSQINRLNSGSLLLLKSRQQ
jgi:hypothetical protein